MAHSLTPKFREFATEQECKDYYINVLCKADIRTHDGYKVRFRPNHFNHAFFESDGKTRRGRFSFYRAKYIDWIRPTIEKPSGCHQGWDYKKGKLAPFKRVAYRYQTYVVVIEFRRNKKSNKIEAEFITAYDANHSFEKITRQPKWDSKILK